jgi:hypothetical protein
LPVRSAANLQPLAGRWKTAKLHEKGSRETALASQSVSFEEALASSRRKSAVELNDVQDL